MLFMEAHCPCRKAQRRSAPCELYGADDECRHLRKHGAQRRAEGAHAQPYNEHRVQRNIRRRGNDHERHGCRRIAQPALQRANQVISKGEHGSRKHRIQVPLCLRHRGGRSLHKPQYLRHKQKPQYGHNSSHQRIQRHAGVGRILRLLYIARTQQAADDHQHPRRHARQSNDHHVQDRPAHRNRSQAFRAGKPADKQHVHRVVGRLHQIRDHDRYGESQQAAPDGTARHIVRTRQTQLPLSTVSARFERPAPLHLEATRPLCTSQAVHLLYFTPPSSNFPSAKIDIRFNI